MNGPSREEIDAKLGALESRQNGRMAVIEAKLDALRDQLASFRIAVAARFDAAEARMTRLESRVGETHAYLSNLKNTIIVAALASVVGVAALNATVMSNMVEAFQSGKENAAIQADIRRQSQEIAATQTELRRQSQETTTILREMKEKLHSERTRQQGN